MSRATIPAQGEAHEALLSQLNDRKQGDVDYLGGRTWSMVYYAGDEHDRFLKAAHGLYFSSNGLNPMAFKSLHQMEREVVQMTASMLHGPDSAVGTMTSGGTESILMAVKTYRDRARKKWPWIRRPNMVVPASMHVAVDKGGHYFGVRLKRAPVSEHGVLDLRAMARLIDRNTIALGASAPEYPHGVVDPIAEIGALAQRHRIGLHVDACFGGFILPWVERLGRQLPSWDFRVPGVTSMSADVHKYGYAAKGASVILYRDPSYLRHQFYVQTDWCGGVYASPSMAGTRPGGSIAAAWAAMRAVGEQGYIARTEVALRAADALREGIRGIEGLRLLGRPDANIVTYASAERGLHLFAVADAIQAKGWSVDRQQFPASVHCTVSPRNEAVVERYLDDLRAAVAYCRAHPESGREGEAAMYGMMAKVPVRRLVKHSVLDVMGKLYGPYSDTPADEGLPVPGFVKKLASIELPRWGRRS